MRKEINYLKGKTFYYLKKIPLNIFKDKKGKVLPFIKEIEDISNLSIIKLSGPIDANTIPIIKNNSKKKIKQYLNKNILIDFKDATHVDSSTLGSLLDILIVLKQNYRKLGLINVNPVLKEYIKIANLKSIICVYSTIEEALEDMNIEPKVCPYFKFSDRKMQTGKCYINKKKPIIPGRIDRKIYCLQSTFSICPIYKKHKNKK